MLFRAKRPCDIVCALRPHSRQPANGANSYDTYVHPIACTRYSMAAAATRKFFVGGNWKMNGNKASYKELLTIWNAADVNKDVEVVIGVPAPYLDFVRSEMRDDFGLSTQNCLDQASGAFTGEISPEMALDCGATWAIIGHSERRAIFQESNETVGKKTAFCVKNKLKVMACIGEMLEDREAGKTMDICAAQLNAIAACIDDAAMWSDIVIAYEPVWAIGTGKTATPEMAQDTHKEIRAWLAANVSPEVAAATRILYGGSVKPANCVDLGKQEDIDGFLVGGASLKPDFDQVINATKA